MLEIYVHEIKTRDSKGNFEDSLPDYEISVTQSTTNENYTIYCGIDNPIPTNPNDLLQFVFDNSFSYTRHDIIQFAIEHDSQIDIEGEIFFWDSPEIEKTMEEMELRNNFRTLFLSASNKMEH